MTSAKIATGLLVLLLGAGLPRVAAAQTKIGVVDMQRALAETEDGRKAKDMLKKLFEQRQKMLDKQQDDLKTLKEGIEKQKDVLSKDVLTKKLEEYQKALGELQNTYMEFQRELQSKEGELTKPIIDRMQRVMRRIGQSEGFALILERNEAGVVYIPSSYDLTDVLIQRYNSGEGREEEPKAPAAAAKATGGKPAAPSANKGSK